ncbi:MAG TPA: DUF4388 domain-containing protein [Thermoanaerobaculales bacterium]|nr:DUF4388 domain-containing protein [Thermoanaerobaculales bacterium]HPA82051.1 DUF4388 domain-containing protein [Thermoanaerobaculales bacterium]HQN94840.1 DUF4388 domain-containing protein [Thermoanaerobaculales bacterium]
MALEGTLRDFSFADILQLISLQRKTGVLTLKHEEKLVTISFVDGCIVGSSSLNQHPEDRIGLILLKRGELTEDGLEMALRRQEETLQRLGRILIDSRVVSPDSIRIALGQQILQVVYRVFRWSDGEYHFSQEKSVDYDRDLMVPMAADSIIMEGARMTDEWPFIDQRIPDRSAILMKVDPARQFEVIEAEERDIDELRFSFADSPEEAPRPEPPGDRLTRDQMLVYDLVNGRDTVEELILRSPLIEFETCKALADLVDRRIVRQASPEEIARQVSRDAAATPELRRSAPIPWLAIPLAAVLAFSVAMIPFNAANPIVRFRPEVWNGIVQQGVSWLRLVRLARTAETFYALEGLYPESAADLLDAGYLSDVSDPWRRPYRLSTREGRLVASGTDAKGEPAPALTISRNLAMEPDEAVGGSQTRPGVRLLE